MIKIQTRFLKVPENKEYQLGKIAGLRYGKMISRSDMTESGYPVYSGYRITGFTNKYMLEEPAVIVVARGVGGTGDVKISPAKSWITNLSIIIDVDEGVADKKYLQLYLHRDNLKQKLDTGAAQSQITINSLSVYRVNLPPLEYQKRVALIIQKYDDLIANNSKRIEKLESMARLLFRQNIDEATELPVSEVTSLISRGISPKYDDTGNSLVINQRCIREQKIDLTLARLQSKPVSETKLIRNGDVLINSTGVGTLGRVAQVFGDYENTTVDSHVSIVRPNELVDPYFFGAAMLDRQEDFERLGTGATGQTELGRDAVGRVVIELPSFDIQREIGGKIKVIRELVKNLQTKNSKLVSARDLLLPQLMSGRLEI